MKESRKTQYTRKVLEDSLIELMKEHPFEKISIKALCELADVNRSTFYLHYEDIYALLHSIEEEVLSWQRDVVAELAMNWPEGRETTIDSMERLFVQLKKNNRSLQVLMSDKGDLEFQRKFFTAAYKMYDSPGIRSEAKFFDADDLRFVFAVNGGVGVVQHWLKTDLQESPRQIAETLFEMTKPIHFQPKK